MKYLLLSLICLLITVGIDSSAIAKKHKAKPDSVVVQTENTSGTTPVASIDNSSENAGKILGMSILGFIFLLWILPSIVPAIIASAKGRSGLGVFLLSIVFTPIIGLIVALLMQSAKKTTV